MPRPSPTRNARFQAFRKTRPSLTNREIATYLERNMKTVQMWTLGYPGSIPLDTVRLLELAFPSESQDDDLIG